MVCELFRRVAYKMAMNGQNVTVVLFEFILFLLFFGKIRAKIQQKEFLCAMHNIHLCYPIYINAITVRLCLLILFFMCFNDLCAPFGAGETFSIGENS